MTPSNANELILLVHVAFGVACLLAAGWVFVETMNVSPSNVRRIRAASWLAALAMWLAIFAGGYWYVVFYKADKAVILKGPWPWAHSLFMETKEHLVLLLLLLATYLPVTAANDLASSREARRMVRWVAGLIVLLALLMDGEGGIIAMGVKVGLLAK
jgi:hypothetical protein